MRRRRNGGLIAVLMIFCLMTGFVLGMIVIHMVDSKNEKEKTANLKDQVNNEKSEDTDQDKQVNVYVPKRRLEAGQILKNAYIQDNFVIEDGFMAYYNENGEKISHVGVDLSYHNDKVDWEKLANSSIEFVMLRCGYRGYTEGGLIEDERFREYAKAANDYGIKLGVYFFTQAITEEEAISEAEYVIDLLEEYDISYPVAFDTEKVEDSEARTTKAELSKEDLSNICIAFCERIKEAGYYPMIYASENWIRRQLEPSMLTDYDFWAPQYIEKNDFLYDFTIWQYTDKGNAPGVEGACDLNISMIDYSAFVPQIRQSYITGGQYSEYSNENPNISISTDGSNSEAGATETVEN